ncbi:TetR/AcrR family transcriptional regulator C-terminal domain-containing protein [Nocardia pseudovaccinii]|uniref:TetR/AcrR family transcriptional regulator C-terminal domain-containing protein n=1 Tax=Nocardia pseudovaccinii TaxID=189540 RepID=UPI000AC569DC
MVDSVYAEIRPVGDGWREVLRSLAETTRQAAHQHEWFADLIGGRPQLGPHALARGEAVVAAMGGLDVDTVMPVVDAVNAYVIGAVRREITESPRCPRSYATAPTWTPTKPSTPASTSSSTASKPASRADTQPRDQRGRRDVEPDRCLHPRSGGMAVPHGASAGNKTDAVETTKERQEGYSLLIPFNIYRAPGLAARPRSCCRISSRSLYLRK